jgi:hypothetical protein
LQKRQIKGDVSSIPQGDSKRQRLDNAGEVKPTAPQKQEKKEEEEEDDMYECLNCGS